MIPAIRIDLRSERGDLLARFVQDEGRGRLFLFLEPAHQLQATVHVYRMEEWGDVRPEEVCLWWEGERRCWVAVRGRIRRIDVQREDGTKAPPPDAHTAAILTPEDEDDDVTMGVDVWHGPECDMIGRFDQDSVRGALYLASPEPRLLALVHVYDLSEWPDVRPDEVRVWWEGDRCWVAVRGRCRYVDRQVDEEPPAALRKAS